MATHSRLIAAASILALALSLSACSKPAPAPDPSETAALVEPASASDANSSMQTAGNSVTPTPGAQGGCHQVQIGGGYQPGANGAPGVMTPSQTITICAPPSVAAAPVAAPVPAGPAPARAEPAAPDTD